MVAQRLFGIETEYAICGIGPDRERLTEPLASGMTRVARSFLKFLPGRVSTGIFLENGARFYLDCGAHPEYATPECTEPTEAVRHTLAGERVLAEVLRRLQLEHPRVEMLSWRANVDYSTGTTWGQHESHLHRADLETLPRDVIPHLVSRVIYTGAGGFNNLSHAIEFLLSPRVAHLKFATSAASTSNRGIFHTKNEQLARNGAHRLHIICGETLCGQLGAWLKVATTALIVALAEAGLAPGAAVELANPLAALQSFASDVTCRAAAPLKARRPKMSALAIQRHYLEACEAERGRDFMPAWADEACARWREELDRLEDGAAGVESRLDWAIKHRLFESHLKRRGFDWISLEPWNRLARERNLLKQPAVKPEPRLRDLAAYLRRASRDAGDKGEVEADAAKTAAQLDALLSRHGLDRSGLERFEAVRAELFEIDVRFGQLGGNGIFAALEAAGVLEHTVAGVDPIDDAITTAPPTTRARARGAAVAELCGQPDVSCEWEGVFDSKNARSLDLGDPFDTRGQWIAQRAKRAPAEASVVQSPSE